EIIVVDGTSTDKTVEIAKKYGAKVIVTENLPNFHINKQRAIDSATKDWILQLDADERVTPELAREIKEKIENSVNGYWVARKNWFLGRFLLKGGQYPDYTLRLYRKGKGHLPQVHVHEQAEVVGRVEYLKYALLHYPYRNFISYIIKWNRYNNLLTIQIKESLKNRNFPVKLAYAVGYLIIKPSHWFLTTYIRHKGFMDWWPGFVFSFFSSLRFPIAYFKYLKVL
ncbi:glycosyltransferase family 2 protein, partial [Candidatus Daviesbacteria bacterium]|nr:glycosyltransferase family 2 protein [Candidatus Daviesbacteria bacterium]